MGKALNKPTARDWIHDHADHAGEDCLIWPYHRKPKGYGTFGYTEGGEKHVLRAHRYMCELAHGAPPTPGHEAAHSCGNASCVNPRHLSWKTPSENGLDCRRHGTHIRNPRGNRPTLAEEKVAEMRLLAGEMTQAALAKKYGVSENTVWDILHGRRRSRPRTCKAPFTDDQVREIRQSNARGMTLARKFGCDPQAIYRVRSGESYRDVK